MNNQKCNNPNCENCGEIPFDNNLPTEDYDFDIEESYNDNPINNPNAQYNNYQPNALGRANEDCFKPNQNCYVFSSILLCRIKIAKC